jgi:hypothetical protein
MQIGVESPPKRLKSVMHPNAPLCPQETVRRKLGLLRLAIARTLQRTFPDIWLRSPDSAG